MNDKTSPDFWRSIKADSTITLSDQQAITDSIERGTGVAGIDYIVESIWKIREMNGLAEWLLFKLDEEDQELWLVVKIVDQHLNLLVFFEPDEFIPDNRRDVVERGDTWLFEEPEDNENFEFDALQFVSEIEWSVQTGENGETFDQELLYRMKQQGVLYGHCTHDPVQAGIKRILTSVIEYATDSDYENPELMLLELGGENSSDGGLITMLVGNSINMDEVDVLRNRMDKPVERKKPSLWEKFLKKMS